MGLRRLKMSAEFAEDVMGEYGVSPRNGEHTPEEDHRVVRAVWDIVVSNSAMELLPDLVFGGAHFDPVEGCYMAMWLSSLWDGDREIFLSARGLGVGLVFTVVEGAPFEFRRSDALQWRLFEASTQAERDTRLAEVRGQVEARAAEFARALSVLVGRDIEVERPEGNLEFEVRHEGVVACCVDWRSLFDDDWVQLINNTAADVVSGFID